MATARRQAGFDFIDWGGFLLFSLWTVYRIYTHIPWRDELQALIIAREATGILSLFHNLAYEGNPGLWHLVLLAACQFDDSPRVLAIVQSLVAVATFWLLWLRAPFAWPTKALLSLSYFIGFEYGVLARAYGLGVLLFFAFVWLRRNWWSWIVLGLLANVSLGFLVLAALLGAAQLYRGQRSAAGIAVFVAMLGIAVITGWPAADAVPPVTQPAALASRLGNTLGKLSGAVLPANPSTPHYYWDVICIDCRGIGEFSLDYFMLFALVSLRKRYDLALVYLGFLIALILIGTFIYYRTTRHYGLLFVAFVGLFWIAWEDGAEPAAWPLLGWATLSAAAGMWAAFWSFHSDFSKGRAVAEWIREHGLQHAIWAAYPGHAGTDLSGFLGIPTYNLQARRWNTFIKWNYPADVRLPPDELAAAAAAVPSNGGYYLLTNPNFDPDRNTQALLRDRGVLLQAIAGFENPYFGFRLYRVEVERNGAR